MKGFKDVTVYIHGKGIIKTNIGIKNDKIIYIGDNPSNIDEICKIDGIMVAGFIDEHTHGAGGYDAMDGTTTAIKEISKTLCREGTTAFLATTMTQNLESINTSLKTISSLNHDNDTVVIPGDISWAMTLENTARDFAFINNTLKTIIKAQNLIAFIKVILLQQPAYSFL